MAALLAAPEQQFVDPNGKPYAGGKLATYVAGTTTPKATWTDIAGTASNGNPIVLDSAGRAIIYGDGLYRLVLSDAAGNQIWDQPATTIVSAAMAPVMIAPTIAAALALLGLDPNEASTRASADAAEAAARQAADANEAAARVAGDAASIAAVTAETTRAEAAEATINTNLATAETNINAAIAGISGSAASGVRAGRATSNGSGHIAVTFTPAFTNGVVYATVPTDGTITNVAAMVATAGGFSCDISGVSGPLAGYNAGWFSVGF
jgi:hypothetical protein